MNESTCWAIFGCVAVVAVAAIVIVAIYTDRANDLAAIKAGLQQCQVQAGWSWQKECRP